MLWQPTLKGQLIHLRPMRPDDFEALYAAASDPLIWEQHPESTRWQRDVFRRYFDGGLESHGALLVLDAKNGAVIGSSRYAEHDLKASTVEVGWTFLTRAYWGGPTNAELKRLMLGYAFEHVSAVLFRVGERNLRSQKAVLKLGAVEDRREGESIVFRLTRP
jgi:RimJ/RimL family protein N-acetyltransferase